VGRALSAVNDRHLAIRALDMALKPVFATLARRQ
jgi:hypothetical protein